MCNQEKQCGNCGKSFETKYPSKKYCSDYCKQRAKDKRKGKVKADKPCPVCGKPSNNPDYKNSIFCSKECAESVKQCLFCGKDLPKVPTKKSEMYCDNVCAQRDYKRKTGKGKVGTELECTVCRKKYIRIPFVNGKLHCGDEECKKEIKRRNQRKREEESGKHYLKSCEHCGKEFKTNKKNQRFCSSKCWGESKRDPEAKARRMRKQKGFDSRRIRVDYTAFKVDHNHIFERDNWQCQNCGCKVKRYENAHDSKRMPDQATIDHVKPVTKGGEHVISNVQTLCRHCNCNVKQNKELYGPPINWKVGTPYYKW